MTQVTGGPESGGWVGRQAPIDASALIPILKRLEEAIQEETEALRSQNTSALPQLFQRKSQGLLELASAHKSLGAVALSDRARAAIQSLYGNLELNRDILRLHLDATAELIEVFSQAVRDSESDGTYDAALGRQPRK